MQAITLAMFAVGLVSASDSEPIPTAIRMIDLNGDGTLDRLHLGADGSVAVSLNQGGRTYASVAQALPSVVVSDVLVADLDGDGHTDLYLVSPQENVALAGDGTGVFRDATGRLGLADGGVGQSALHVDVDGDGALDVLLHNQSGDAVFWNERDGAFARDAATPEVVPSPALTPVVMPLQLTPPGAAAATAGGSGSGPLGIDRAPAAPGGGTTLSPGGTAGGTLSGGGLVTGLSNPTLAGPLAGSALCVNALRDQTTLACLLADSSPTLGRLYPLGPEFFISPGGNVGINNLAPTTTLDVNGTMNVTGDLAFGGTPLFDNTSIGSTLLGRHSGSGSPITFDLVEDSTSTSNLNNYGMLALTRRNISADGAGSGLYFEGTRNGGLDFEYAGVGMRVEQGLSSAVGASGSLRFYTSNNGASRQNTLTVMPDGDLEQPIAVGGLMKGGAHIDANGLTPTVSRSFTNLPGASSVSVIRLGTGTYEVDFGADVSQRFYMGVLGNAASGSPAVGTIRITPRITNPNALFVQLADSAGVSDDFLDFFIAVY